jgi:hypothetical protein
LQSGNTVCAAVATFALDLRNTAGFLVADRAGRVLGRVERPMYGTAPDVPDAIAVRGGIFSRQRHLVPANVIDSIDGRRGVIELLVERHALTRFL